MEKSGKLKKKNQFKTCKQEKDYLKWAAKPSYMSHKIFHNDLVAISKIKVTLTLKRPAYIGMCILELSEVFLYKFHYNYNKNKHGNNSRPLFTDSDSLMYEIKTQGVHADFSNDKKLFDFSNY